MMTPEQRYWWRIALELKLRKSSGDAFQDFFSTMMATTHGADFVRVRAFGALGDKGCDGYLQKVHGTVPENDRLPIRLLPTPPTCRMLPGSGVKLCVGRCGDVARDAEQGTEGVERIEPPVEAEGEFVEVGLQVLVD